MGAGKSEFLGQIGRLKTQEELVLQSEDRIPSLGHLSFALNAIS